MISLHPTFWLYNPLTRLRLMSLVEMSTDEELLQRNESYYAEIVSGRQFTGDTFKLPGRAGESKLSQTVGISNKKSYGANKLSVAGKNDVSQWQHCHKGSALVHIFSR